jgi:hypothetical protein
MAIDGATSFVTGSMIITALLSFEILACPPLSIKVVTFGDDKMSDRFLVVNARLVGHG